MTDISELFPLKATVTEDDLLHKEEGVLTCAGARCLRRALGEWVNERAVSWGTTSGSVDKLLITTQEKVNIPTLKEETPVTFIAYPMFPNT